jgi:hypothetical protein|tara:strand:- start:133 stop:270 length:138 start_codon:yes stop_codon:yes gene_type:complete
MYGDPMMMISSEVVIFASLKESSLLTEVDGPKSFGVFSRLNLVAS